MKNLKSICLALLAILFTSSCTVEQPRFEATAVSSWRAIAGGEIKEALAFHETTAKEAEKRREWEAATRSYIEAARAARVIGQLETEIIYVTKALETADRTKSPNLRVYAAFMAVFAYRGVRNFDKAREFVDKGFEIVKEIPPNTNARVNWESNLYRVSGMDLLTRREYDKAIDAFSRSRDLQQVRLSDLYRSKKPNQTSIEDSRTNLIHSLSLLGNAYREAGRFQEALEQYQQASNYIKEWGLRYYNQVFLHEYMGRLYLRQKDFPQALENFNKALAFAESQQRPTQISSASVGIGEVLRLTGRPAEAMPYYQKAIQQIESVRSVLQAEEYRQSYFEGELDAYVRMMEVLLSVEKQAEAFNYNERARSRTFLDVVGTKVQLSRLRSGLLEEERALQERIAAIKAGLGGQREAVTETESLRKELGEAEKAYNAFLAKVRKPRQRAGIFDVCGAVDAEGSSGVA